MTGNCEPSAKATEIDTRVAMAVVELGHASGRCETRPGQAEWTVEGELPGSNSSGVATVHLVTDESGSNRPIPGDEQIIQISREPLTAIIRFTRRTNTEEESNDNS